MQPESGSIIVTGASSGIGRATCLSLLDKGYKVIGIARDFEKFGALPSGFTTIKLDLSNLDAVETRLKTLSREIERIGGLVCCAGQGRFGCLETFSAKQIRELIDLNLTSTILMIRAVIPRMKTQGYGDIIVIGSESAIKGGQQGSVYCASKFGLRDMLQSLREETASSGLRTTLINPGMVRSPFFDSLSFAPGEHADNYIEPTDVAETILHVLSARPHTVFDEINLSPLKKVVKKQ